MMSSKRENKVAIVTGGTDGIGKETARGLARAGHSVLVVGRDKEKGDKAVRELRQTTGNSDVQFLGADLSLMSDAHRICDEIAESYNAIHYLVHSAGIVRGRRLLTAERVESNFAVNYLSRFVITTRLLPLLESGGHTGEASRIVIIGGAAQNGKIHFDDVNLTRNFNTIRAVTQFCQANDVFTIELSRRLAATGKSPFVTITCLKIGVVKTNIRREFPWWMKFFVPLVFDPLLGQTPHQAAHSALALLMGQNYEGVTGALFSQIRKFKRVEPRKSALDPSVGNRLWNLSENLYAKRIAVA